MVWTILNCRLLSQKNKIHCQLQERDAQELVFLNKFLVKIRQENQ